MASPPVEQAPCSYQVSGRWVPLLEAADGWLPTLHLGVIHAVAGDIEAAADAWTRSIATEPTAWAWRNLAVLAQADGDLPVGRPPLPGGAGAARRPGTARRELLHALLAAGDGGDALAVIEAAPAEHRALGRFRLAEIRAALLIGDLDRAGRALEPGVLPPDVREGETALHEVWFDYQVGLAARDQRRPAEPGADSVPGSVPLPVPPQLDFRM